MNDKTACQELFTKFLFYSVEQERNAYISELYSLLKEKYNCDINTNPVSEYFNIIRQEEFYKTYINVGKELARLKGNNTEINKSVFLQCCSILQNKRGEKLSETFNIVYNDWEKWNKQLSKVIPKVICDFVENEHLFETN